MNIQIIPLKMWGYFTYSVIIVHATLLGFDLSTSSTTYILIVTNAPLRKRFNYIYNLDR